MSSKLIIIRGNSGSGKSTVARTLREELGEHTMLIQQDIVRREMLFVKDRIGNPTIALLPEMVLYGKSIGYDVILEGILSKKLYGETMKELIKRYGHDAYVFYMDVSFEETLQRHDTKPNRHEYGSEKMKEWWLEKDYLDLPFEYIIPENLSPNEAVQYILSIVAKSS